MADEKFLISISNQRKKSKNNVELKEALNVLLMDESLNKIENHINKPNLFKILSVSNTEIRHSNFLAWLLDPKANHGLGDQFLRRYMKKVIEVYFKNDKPPKELYQIDSMDLSDVQVYREKHHIDVIVDFGPDNELVAVIENKVKSKQSKDQLDTYYDVINEDDNYSEWGQIFLFLTMEDETPDDSNWIDARYDLIRDILEDFIKQDKFAPQIKQYVEDYLWILNNELMADELQEMCDSIYHNHKLAIDTINEYRTNPGPMMKEYIVNELAKIKKDGKPYFIPLKSITSHIHFTTPELRKAQGNDKGDHSWLDKNEDDILAFEIKNSMEGDASIRLIIGPGDPKIRLDWFNKCRERPDLFKTAASKKKDISDKYTRLYTKKVNVSSKIDATKKAYSDAIIEFVNQDLEDIEQFFVETRIE